jgi:hypothetical protein
MYREVGHVPGGAAIWKSHSTCSAKVLGDYASLAAHDLDDKEQVLLQPGSLVAFNQNWKVTYDTDDNLGRSIIYAVSFSYDRDGSTIIQVYAEAEKNVGASIYSTPFDNDHKDHLMLYMPRLFLHATECGLDRGENFRFG